MTLLPILLPEGFVSKVAVNDKITAGDAVAIAEKQDLSEKTVQVSQILGIEAPQIGKFLQKHLGDAIAKDEILAEKSGAFGKGTKKIISEFSGTIVKINTASGEVVIRGSEKAVSLKTINSPVAGTVDFCNNEKIVIKTDKDVILALDGSGEGAQGEIRYFAVLEESSLGREIAGKIILSGEVDRVSLFKDYRFGRKRNCRQKVCGY